MPKLYSKAQFEIMGLAFIMILVMMGVLFGLYVMTRPETNLARDFSQSQLASNWLNTYKGMSTDCYNAPITRLLSDCVTIGQISCPTGETSCEYAKRITHLLLKNTLEKWNRSYNLTIEGSSNPSEYGALQKIGEQKGSCKGDIQKDVQPIPTGAGQIRVILSICT